MIEINNYHAYLQNKREMISTIEHPRKKFYRQHTQNFNDTITKRSIH